MTLADMALIAALLVFLGVWWWRGAPERKWVLLGSVLAALAASLADFLDDRWQAAAGVGAALVFLAVLGVNRLRRTDKHWGVPFVSGVIFTLIAAVPVIAIVMFPVWPLPKPSGEFTVGVRTFEIDDASRPGLFNASKDAPRRLLARVWYPAGDTSGFRQRPYFTKRESETTARTLGGLVGFPEFFTYLKHVQTNAFEDAPLVKGAHRSAGCLLQPWLHVLPRPEHGADGGVGKPWLRRLLASAHVRCLDDAISQRRHYPLRYGVERFCRE